MDINIPKGYRLVPSNARVSVPTGSSKKGRPQKVNIEGLTEEEALKLYTKKQIYNARHRLKQKMMKK